MPENIFCQTSKHVGSCTRDFTAIVTASVIICNVNVKIKPTKLGLKKMNNGKCRIKMENIVLHYGLVFLVYSPSS